MAAWLLLVLSPICAEYLSAYDDSTGRPLTLLVGLAFFVPLYGAPALVIREVARRRGLGWPGIVVLAAAMGLVQAGLVDQSLFIVDYRDISEAEESTRATWVPGLGFGMLNLVNYVGGHALFSFCAPIAVAEGVGGDRQRWVGPVGLVLAVLAWAVVAVTICVATLQEEAGGASPAQLVGTSLVVVALVAVALRLGPARRRAGRTPSPWVAFAVGFGLAVAPVLVGENWFGVIAHLVGYGGLAWFLVRYGATPGWTRGHGVAVATGILLSRAATAFTYYPLVGETTAAQKYGHNVAMVAIVLAVGILAWRASRGPVDDGIDGA